MHNTFLKHSDDFPDMNDMNDPLLTNALKQSDDYISDFIADVEPLACFGLNHAPLSSLPPVQSLPGEDTATSIEDVQDGLARREKETLRRKKRRQRAKNERENLRLTVCELTKQVHKVRLTRKAESRLNSRPINSFSKHVVDWQRQARLRAEAEQQRLIAAAQVQASYIQHLRSLVHGHGCAPTDDGVGSIIHERTAPDHTLSRLLEPSEATLCMALLRETNTFYTRIDEEHRGCGITELPDGVANSVQRRMSDGEVAYYQHLDKGTVPFSCEQTQQAMWKLANFRHRQKDLHDFECLAYSNDTTICNFRLVRELVTGSKVSVRQRFVGRRYGENNRMVYIWKIYSEVEGLFSGMQSDETGWCIIRSSSDSLSSKMEVCARQVPVTQTER